MGGYEFIEHTADILIKARGEDLPEAYAQAAQAMFDVITGGASLDSDRSIEFDLESPDLEGLLVGFLSHLIVIHETENVVLSSFEITLPEPNRLRARVGAETFDVGRHGQGTPVKGISYHMLEIDTGGRDRPATVQVLFDI
jgi:SHS2 domain-containing protein